MFGDSGTTATPPYRVEVHHIYPAHDGTGHEIRIVFMPEDSLSISTATPSHLKARLETYVEEIEKELTAEEKMNAETARQSKVVLGILRRQSTQCRGQTDINYLTDRLPVRIRSPTCKFCNQRM